MSLLLPPPPGGPQFTAGSKPHGNQATQDLDIGIQQPLEFCTAGIFARVRQASATQTLTGSANNVIHYDTVDEDGYSGWSGSPNWYWQAPSGCSGWYHVSGTVSANWTSSAVEMRAMINVSGAYLYTLKQDDPGPPNIQSGSCLVYLFGGVDTIQVQVFAYAAGLTTITTAGQQSSMQVSWISN